MVHRRWENAGNRIAAVRHTDSRSGVSMVSRLTQQLRALDEYRQKARPYSIGPGFDEEGLVMVAA